jgi:hypothetical protein
VLARLELVEQLGDARQVKAALLLALVEQRPQLVPKLRGGVHGLGMPGDLTGLNGAIRRGDG